MEIVPLFAAAGPSLLSRIDYAIISLCFVVVLGIGFYLKKRASTGEDFFLARRKMTAFASLSPVALRAAPAIFRAAIFRNRLLSLAFR